LKWKIGDYPLWLWIYKNSKLKFLDYTTTVHRVIRGSESNKGNRLIINFESFKIGNFFLKKYNVKESLKSYLVRRTYLLLVCIKNEPKSLLKILKNI
jgi:hypothetical protein